jgi:hyaluronoglucosaminidase
VILDLLSPVPRFARIDGPPLPLDPAVVTGSSADSPAWRALADLEPELLGPGGHGLRIREAGGRAAVTVAAADRAGVLHAQATLDALLAAAALTGQTGLPQLSIRDEPALPWRGTIEGFYGPPWSHEERLDHLRFCARNKLNSYSYAPKDDPYHRERWREPYPPAELARLAELVRLAEDLGVRFTYTIAPGLSMIYSSPDEQRLLFAKAEQLWAVGVRSFALLFDDIPAALQHPADVAEFGAEEGAAGAAHGRVCAEFRDRFLVPRGGDRLAMAPTEYAGIERSPYRTRLAETLPQDALVWWTGCDIVVGTVSRADIDGAAAAFGRDLLLWDNFPVNDFDATRLFLGPLLGRSTDLDGSRLHGISANPMVQASASRLALATVADWAWNPAAYDPTASARRAALAVAGSLASALLPLLAVTSGWPPSADRAPHLSPLLAPALRREPEALERVDAALASLADLPTAVGEGSSPVVDQLRRWLAAAAAEAAIARDATALLAAGGSVPADMAERLLGRLDRLAAEPHDVLRALLSAYTRAAVVGDTALGPLEKTRHIDFTNQPNAE